MTTPERCAKCGSPENVYYYVERKYPYDWWTVVGRTRTLEAARVSMEYDRKHFPEGYEQPKRRIVEVRVKERQMEHRLDKDCPCGPKVEDFSQSEEGNMTTGCGEDTKGEAHPSHGYTVRFLRTRFHIIEERKRQDGLPDWTEFSIMDGLSQIALSYDKQQAERILPGATHRRGRAFGASVNFDKETCASCGELRFNQIHLAAITHRFVPAPAAGCRICGTYTCLVHDVPATRGRTEKGEK